VRWGKAVPLRFLRNKEKMSTMETRVFTAAILAGLVVIGPVTAVTAGERSDVGRGDSNAAADAGDANTEAAPPVKSYAGDLWTRPALTGDWGGARDTLAQKGITFDLDVTQTFQSVLGGGLGHAWNYGGHMDMILELDTGKMGLWQGGFLKLMAETQFGEFSNLDSAVLSGVNTLGMVPLPDNDDINLTDALFMQFLSERFAVILGKTQTMDGDGVHFSGRRGKHNFLNPNFIYNAATIRTAPYSSLMAGVLALLPNLWGNEHQPSQLAVSVLGATGEPNVPPWHDFDDDVAFDANLRVFTEFLGMPGSQLAGFTLNTTDFNLLSQDRRLLLFALLASDAAPLKRANESWAFYYNFHQYLHVEPGQDTKRGGYGPDEDPLQGVGVFGRIGYADKRTSPIEGFYSIGVGGRGIIPGRDNDTFGVGWYMYDLSSDMPNPLGILRDNPCGLEAFYNIEIARSVHLTIDYQILQQGRRFTVDLDALRPLKQDLDTAHVLGLRLHVAF